MSPSAAGCAGVRLSVFEAVITGTFEKGASAVCVEGAFTEPVAFVPAGSAERDDRLPEAASGASGVKIISAERSTELNSLVTIDKLGVLFTFLPRSIFASEDLSVSVTCYKHLR